MRKPTFALQQAQKVLGLSMARVASGHKDNVDARKHFENSFPFGQGGIYRLRIGVILVHRRVPDRKRPIRSYPLSVTSQPSFALGRGKRGLSGSSSDRGGMSSIALAPKIARSRMYWSHISTVHASYALVWTIAELMSTQGVPGVVVYRKPAVIEGCCLPAKVNQTEQLTHTKKDPAFVAPGNGYPASAAVASSMNCIRLRSTYHRRGHRLCS